MERAPRPTRWVAVALAGVALTLVSVASAAPVEAPSESETGCQSLRAGRQAVDVRWSSVRPQTPGCFFFSGPGRLGRDDTLGARATLDLGSDRVQLSFGPHTFAGPRRGPGVTLTRRSTHSFSGEWQVDETMRGRLRDVGPGCRALQLHYTYEECQRGRACPGQCRIDADLLVTAH